MRCRREALCRKPAFDHPGAGPVEVGDGVRDATEPALIFATPFQ